MRDNHQLLDHPLFEELPIKEVLEPFGFEVAIALYDTPTDPAFDDEGAIETFATNPAAYIDSLHFEHPADFAEIGRWENEDGEIVCCAVKAKTVFAQFLLNADPRYAHISPYLDVWRERMRQLSVKEFSRDHDDKHNYGALAAAAGCYALTACLRVPPYEDESVGLGVWTFWPWSAKRWKPSADPRRNLIKAGALILAEIERLDRAAQRLGGGA